MFQNKRRLQKTLIAELVILVVILILGLISCQPGQKTGNTPTNPGPEFHKNLKPYSFKDNKDSYTILAFGDFGNGAGLPSDPQSVVARSMTQVCSQMKCDFAIGLGDNIYPSGVTSVDDPSFYFKFELPYQDLEIPMFMTLGNHDYAGNIEAQINYHSARWSMPARFFQIQHLPSWLNIFAIDTNREDSVQAQQLHKVMCSAQGWKIMYGHHPLFSNCGHGDNPGVIGTFLPIIQECGIQVYFSGHDHNFESLTTPSFEQVISGSSSDSGGIRHAKERDSILQNYVSDELGFTIIQVTPNSLQYLFFDSHGEVLFQKKMRLGSVSYLGH